MSRKKLNKRREYQNIIKKETNKKTVKPIIIKSEQKTELPKISIKKVISALQSENLNELIPLYAVFLKRDLHLGSEMRKRRRQIPTVALMVESEDENLKDFIKSYLSKIKIKRLLYDISLAIPYGFSIINMVYDNMKINGKVHFAPALFKTIHPRYTEYSEKDRTIKIKLDSGTKINPLEHCDQFLYHEHPEDSGDLVDYAVMSNLLLTCIMKHAVINANMQYFEMLGVPPLYVNTDVQTPEEAHDLLGQIMSLRSNSVGLFPKDTLVNLLLGQTGRTEFLSFVEYCDQQISHNIMGNTLSGNKDGTGSYNLGTIHDDRRKDVLSYDCELIEETMKTLIDIVIADNYPKEDPDYEIYFDTGDSKDEMRLAQIFATLKGAGYKVPVEHIEEILNIEGIEYVEQEIPYQNVYSEKLNQPQVDITEENIPNTSFNGAQVTAMLETINQVSQGLIPKSSAQVMLEVAFQMSEDQAKKMLDFEIKDSLPLNKELNTRQKNNYIVSSKDLEDEIENKVKNIFKSSSSYQDALNELLKAYPDLSFNSAIDTIERVVANTYIYERAKESK